MPDHPERNHTIARLPETTGSRADSSGADRTAPGPPLHEQTIRIYYEDTDAGGIVYHANWLRFFERARTDWLRALGISHTELAQGQGIGLVVRDLRIEFLRPARLDDLVRTELRVLELRRASLTLLQQAWLDPHPEPTVSAQVRVAAVRQARPVALPDLLYHRVTGLLAVRPVRTTPVQAS